MTPFAAPSSRVPPVASVTAGEMEDEELDPVAKAPKSAETVQAFRREGKSVRVGWKQHQLLVDRWLDVDGEAQAKMLGLQDFLRRAEESVSRPLTGTSL